MDREHPAVPWRLDNIAAGYRWQGEVAAQKVKVVAWQQDDVAGLQQDALAIPNIDPDQELALDNEVIENQVRNGPKSWRAMFRTDAGGHTPRREEISV